MTTPIAERALSIGLSVAARSLAEAPAACIRVVVPIAPLLLHPLSP
jgi:hypothetical protein